MGESCSVNSDIKAAEAAAVFVLRNLHEQSKEECIHLPIDVFWDHKGNTTTVVTTDSAECLGIKLHPCIPKAMKLKPTSAHPDRVRITVSYRSPEPSGSGSTATHTFYAHPEWKEPEGGREEKHAVACEHRPWKWVGDESMHPFWAVRRLSLEQFAAKFPRGIFNMQPTIKEYTVIGAGASTVTVAVPMLTNTKPIAKGVELFWEANATTKKQEDKIRTWIDDHKAQEHKKASENGNTRKRKVEDGNMNEV